MRHRREGTIQFSKSKAYMPCCFTGNFLPAQKRLKNGIKLLELIVAICVSIDELCVTFSLVPRLLWREPGTHCLHMLSDLQGILGI